MLDGDRFVTLAITLENADLTGFAEGALETLTPIVADAA